MRAVFEKIEAQAEESLVVREIYQPYFDAPWHFHPECELTFISRSSGDRFVGDSMESFSSGDLVLLGSDLPHFWRSRKNDPENSRAIVIHFPEEIAGSTPEFSTIKNTLTRARQGLCFSADSVLCAHIEELMKQIVTSGKLKRLLLLLEILGDLTEATARPLSSIGHVPSRDSKASRRINRAYEYIYTNLQNEITLDAVSRTAGMSPAAFSRYFKRITGRNLSHFIGELRISQACKWLRETDRDISEIAFEVGFGSLSNFNRLFKELKGVSPRDWRAG